MTIFSLSECVAVCIMLNIYKTVITLKYHVTIVIGIKLWSTKIFKLSVSLSLRFTFFMLNLSCSKILESRVAISSYTSGNSDQYRYY